MTEFGQQFSVLKIYTQNNRKAKHILAMGNRIEDIICQHIPKKISQMVRYVGYYSNKSRGMRRKEGILRPGDEPLPEVPTDVDIIDVSEYNPPRTPSKTWRECIKKIWEVDVLVCPRCAGSMKIISFITENLLIKQILKHLGLWQQKPSRSPPSPPKTVELVYDSCYDDWPIYEEHYITVN